MPPMGSNAMPEPEDKRQAEPAPLPTFSSGGAVINIADRDALYRAIEEPPPLDAPERA